MPGDYSRNTFNKKKHYRAVLAQQGRVQVDANRNEEQAINLYLLETLARDVIGPCGAPREGGGFKIGLPSYLGVHFAVDANVVRRGWAVDDSGGIVTTADGGENWTLHLPPDDLGVRLRAVSFIDLTHGWAVGDDATIIAFTNASGEMSWEKQNPPVGTIAGLRAVSFVNANQGWAVGEDATILATTDGGRNWISQRAPTGVTARLNGVSFFDRNRGLAVGDGAVILGTNDGGRTWVREGAPAGTEANLHGVALISANQAWAAGDDATVLRTAPRGTNWVSNSPRESVTTANLRGVSFINPSTGWVVGDNGAILFTNNGGDDWTRQDPPSGVNANLRSVVFALVSDSALGWAAGDDATILAAARRNETTTWGKQATPDNFKISTGRIYVDGLLCEMEAEVTYLNQPDLPNAPQPNLANGIYLVYLDVWRREITALDDPLIREVALGGPDTAARLQNVCQVKALRVSQSGGLTPPGLGFTNPTLGSLAIRDDLVVIPGRAAIISGVVSEYRAPAQSQPGSIRIGGRRLTLAPGMAFTGQPVTVGANLRLNVTFNNEGQIRIGSLVIDQNNPVPRIANVTPNTAPRGGALFTIRVDGDNFTNTSVVLWNGENRPTTFVSNTRQLLAQIPASDIVANGSASITVLNPGPGGGISNGAALEIIGGEPANPQISVTNSPDPVDPGENLNYTLRIANTGSAPAQLVNITTATPANTTFVSATPPPGWRLAAPDPGETGQIIFRPPTSTPIGDFTIGLVVRVAPDFSGPAIVNTSAFNIGGANPFSLTTVTTVNPTADLTVSNSGNPLQVQAGADATYSVTVTNNGPGIAREIVVTDDLPSGVAFVSMTAPGFVFTPPPAGSGGTLTWRRQTMAPNATATIAIVVRVNQDISDGASFQNCVRTTATTSDMDMDNNTACVTTVVAPSINCTTGFSAWDALIAPSTGNLNARTQPATGDDDPCLIPPTAGYQRLENQLYRVQIHQGGQLSAATFKWSRDNGSVATAIKKIDGSRVTVSDLGPDDVLGFASGQWVEVIDDRVELHGLPGQLVRIGSVNPATREIEMEQTVTKLSAAHPDGVVESLHPKLRRWDSGDATGGEIQADSAGWITLEGGIEVQFSNGSYRTGDYWLIPARTATGDIEWPPYQLGANPIPQPPLGIEHHYCRLALIERNSSGIRILSDCRRIFCPLPSCPEAAAAANGHLTNVEAAQLRSVLDALKEEGQEMEKKHQEALAARDQEIADLKVSAKDLQLNIRAVNELREQVAKLGKLPRSGGKRKTSE